MNKVFSTKPYEKISDTYYYGFRFYDGKVGRWLNRDPIEESGGLNLFGFVGNDVENKIEFLGKPPKTPYPPPNCGRGECERLNKDCTYHNPDKDWDKFDDEGESCSGEKPGKIKFFKRVDPVSRIRAKMKIRLEIEGTYKDLRIRWRTCERNFGKDAGFIHSCSDKKSCNIPGAWASPVFADSFKWYGGPYSTHTYIAFLSCKNCKWTKQTDQRGKTIVYENNGYRNR